MSLHSGSSNMGRQAKITLGRDAIDQAIKEHVEKLGYKFVKITSPDADPMKRLSDPGSVGVIVEPRPEHVKSCYE